MQMQNPIREDSALTRITARIADLITLNLLTILCSLPVITIGVSMTALFASIRDLMRDVGSSTARQYFHYWKADFAPATKLFLPILAVEVLLGLDAYFLTSGEKSAPLFVWALFILCAVLVSGTSILCFLLSVNFKNTFGHTYVNAFKLCIARFPQAVLSSLLFGWPVILFLASPTLFLQSSILLLLIGVSLPAYFCSLLFRPVIRRLSSPQTDSSDPRPGKEAPSDQAPEQ